ncbi:type IV secretory system conjugative DNA transfer family protein [Phenylobacterium soli]|uniref:Type IV secretory system conjugative DNA transfer family protein n=1 Tax=Phenylobacterium soli TaxID=2170551 RepID=A0A328ALR7_9CAUL|nr:type IV secretory system conjugative DNA transfer family protein [Phenylobacterium soli]RAK55903.1 type IV secretory system conjugative DNA transfer family protein [Phenylobacterium soli]
MSRYLVLAGYVIAGLFVGNVAGGFAGMVLDWIVHFGEAGRRLSIYGGSAVGALLAFGSWRLRYERQTGDVHGSARFADHGRIRRTLAIDDGLIVGREDRGDGRLLRHDGPSHLLTIAPTRSGKGVGAIIPNLLTLDRSVLCVDPKGENTRVTYEARARAGPVHVLDPFGVCEVPSAGYNPMDLLDPASPDVGDDAALLAEALVYDPPAHVGEAHWNEEAKALIAGLMLHVICTKPAAERTLAAVRDLLTDSPDEFDATLAAMQKSEGAGGLVRRAANRHLGKSDREAAGVLSSAQRHTHFLDSARINGCMARSDFRFADLKAEKHTVFLVLPPERLDTYARWLRLLVVQALHELARAPSKLNTPVLFLLDEFAALGRLEPVERAFGLMAGYGVQLWPILQDMHQLWSVYGEQRAGTFLSNAGLVQIFNVADIETATWLSRWIGAATVAYETAGTSSSRAPNQLLATHGTSTTQHLVRRELLTPDEVMRLDRSLEILLRPGEPPIVARKVRYFEDPEFTGLFTRP